MVKPFVALLESVGTAAYLYPLEKLNKLALITFYEVLDALIKH